jgi:ABC-type multidrug transport system fused ATPase/permease subunit
MTSVERVLEYTDLEKENLENSNETENDNVTKDGIKMVKKSNKKLNEKRDGWPHSGEIIFDNVSYSYDSKTLPYVLKNISFRIESGEKVGIVGRTGKRTLNIKTIQSSSLFK